MSSLTAATVMLLYCATAYGVGPAVQDERTGPDYLSGLYAGEVGINDAGVPLVRVRVLAKQRRVRVRSDGGVRLTLGRHLDSQVVLPPGAEILVRVENAQPGKSTYWVSAERYGAGNDERDRLAVARWRSRGYEPTILTSGTRLQLGGFEYDSRVVSVAITPKGSRKDAKAAAVALKKRHKISGHIVEKHVDHPAGVLVTSHGDEEIRAKDLLIIEAVDEASPIKVLGRWKGRGKGERAYDGRLIMVPDDNGRLTVINELDIEGILQGVLPAEMFSRAPLEALKAQAVVARGQMVTKAGHRHRGEPYHLCSESHCQVYRGSGVATPHTRRAVSETRGQVVSYRGVIVDTVYHASCGGMTEDYQKMWQGRSSDTMTGRPDGPHVKGLNSEDLVGAFIINPPAGLYCAESSERSGVFRWSRTIRGEELSKRVNERKAIGPVHTIRVTERGRSGRALAVEYHGSKGTHLVRGEGRNRRLLGNLPSGLWVAHGQNSMPGHEPLMWNFTGGGFGHGVGLCQHGAIGLARRGHGYEAILKHYYRKTVLKGLW